MIGLILATHEEAAPLLKLLKAQELSAAPLGAWASSPSPSPFSAFAFAATKTRPDGVVIISGMGKAAAGLAADHLLTAHNAALVVNLGVCGSLAKDRTIGQIYRIVQTVDGDACEEPPVVLNEFTNASLPNARLASVFEPVFGGERSEQLLERADLVDMEGDAVARVCARRGVPCLMLKGISDLANPTGRDDIRKNIQAVSAQLAEAAMKALDGGLPSPRISGDTVPIASQLDHVPRYLSFIKFEHSVFSLPLLFAGAWVGAGMQLPPWRVLGLIALAGVGARTLGMASNRIFDRHLDALNPRTARRELPSGKMTLAQAWAVAIAGLAIYLLACAGLGKLCLLLSPLPALPLLVYSQLKRFTSLCHFGIGLCQSLGPPAAFVAASGTVSYDSRIALLAAFTFFWMSGFDIIYSLQDEASDRLTGVHSLPVALGPGTAQIVAALLHAAAAAAIIWLWMLAGGGICCGVALALCLAALAAGNLPWLSPQFRFFPLSAIASISGALLPILGSQPWGVP